MAATKKKAVPKPTAKAPSPAKKKPAAPAPEAKQVVFAPKKSTPVKPPPKPAAPPPKPAAPAAPAIDHSGRIAAPAVARMRQNPPVPQILLRLDTRISSRLSGDQVGER